MSSSSRARRAVAEFLLIVAGVSVALTADSVWDYRQDRMAETEYLAQLRTDLAETRQRLTDARTLEQQQHAAGVAALSALASAEVVSPDSARSWLIDRRGLYYSDPRPITGTLSALVQTGDLRLIRAADQRNAIVSYLAQITEDKREFDRFVDESLVAIRMIRAAGATPARPWGLIGDAAVRALVGRPVDPAVPTALEHVITAAEIRQVYLSRMIEATQSIEAVLLQD